MDRREFNARFTMQECIVDSTIRSFSAITEGGEHVAVHLLPDASDPQYPLLRSDLDRLSELGTPGLEILEVSRRTVVVSPPLQEGETLEVWLLERLADATPLAESEEAPELDSFAVLTGSEASDAPAEAPSAPSGTQGGLTQLIDLSKLPDEAVGGDERLVEKEPVEKEPVEAEKEPLEAETPPRSTGGLTELIDVGDGAAPVEADPEPTPEPKPEVHSGGLTTQFDVYGPPDTTPDSTGSGAPPTDQPSVPDTNPSQPKGGGEPSTPPAPEPGLDDWREKGESPAHKDGGDFGVDDYLDRLGEAPPPSSSSHSRPPLGVGAPVATPGDSAARPPAGMPPIGMDSSAPSEGGQAPGGEALSRGTIVVFAIIVVVVIVTTIGVLLFAASRAGA